MMQCRLKIEACIIACTVWLCMLGQFSSCMVKNLCLHSCVLCESVRDKYLCMYPCVVHVAKHIHESTWKYMTSPTCTHVNSYWRVHHVNTRMDIECVFVCMMCVWVCVCFVMFVVICKHMYPREYTSIHPIKAPHMNSREEL